MKTKLLVLILAVILLVPFTSNSTHINGAYFSYKVDSQNPLKYKFKLTIFSDDRSIADDPVVHIGMGDLNQVTVPKTKNISYQNYNSIEVYEWEYTYAAPGNYMVYWVGIYRNPNIINVPHPSDQLTQFIRTQVKAGFTTVNNNSADIIVPAPHEAFVGEPFKTNMIAYDADGDRLTYELVPPQHLNQNSIPQNLPGYQFPVGLHINKFGELHWQNPVVKGEYAISVKITEYREQQPVGYIVVDINLLVKDRDHQPVVKLLNKDRLTINYDGSVYAKPEQTLKLEFFVEKAPNSTHPIYAKQFSDLDTLDLATPDFAARDSANGLAVTLRLTPATSIARNQPYIIGLRGASRIDMNPTARNQFAYGWDFVNVYIGAQQPTSSGDLADNARVQLYPNPVASKFFVEGDNLHNAQLKVFNSNGKHVFTSNLIAGRNLLKRPAHISAGVYVFHIVKGGKTIKSGRLVLE
ncbi:T9SS type A sorting domain-containing protein [uncultured Pontibacter sp.]|uniref:T9SS type A sorting domain-containing protein n=1 Tax=uncultured Pontibacter sp. TaxID=453356 RepID=UPI00262414B9|nr:T9SS type A sorting domain-containing protein [uncultured Pontibacter sp.]